MAQAGVAERSSVFDVDKNAQFALQLFNAYYRTPDPSGKIYAAFPEFVLIKPQSLDGKDLSVSSDEKKLLEDCKAKARARDGYIGVTKYFDEKFDYHWIKLSAYPFALGDTVDEQNDEFFYVLNNFVEFTQAHPDMYGDVTAESASDNDIVLMLQDIAANAAKLQQKLKYYPISMLVSFDPNWPATEVKKLLSTLEEHDQSWNHLLLEYLRYVMRKKTESNIKTKLQNNFAEDVSSQAQAVTMPEHFLPSDVVTTGLVHQILPVLTKRATESVESASDSAASDVEHPTSSSEISLMDTVVLTDVPATVISNHELMPQQALVVADDVTQKNVVFDLDAFRQTQEANEAAAVQTLKLAKMRAAKIAQLSVDAVEKALKLEEEKIRLAAHAVVVARKQAEEAEVACKLAEERIAQTQQARREEEANARELERVHLASEEAARLAASQRAELAEQALREAEKRKQLELELSEREHQQAQQERELQAQVQHRLLAIGEATSAMQAQLQGAIADTQLAQELTLAHQAALSQTSELAEQNRQQREQEEAKLLELERVRSEHEAQAALAASQRAELAAQAQQEAEQRKLLELELAQREQQHLEQERALQAQVQQRLSLIGEATSAMQAHLQSGIEATQLAQKIADTHQSAQQFQQLRQIEENKAHELESVRLAREEEARLAAMQRAELAEHASHEAAQRTLLESELAERERLQAEQERELQMHVQSRLSAIGEATSAMQARIHSEIEATQLAHDLAAENHAAALHATQQAEQAKQHAAELAAQHLDEHVATHEPHSASDLHSEHGYNPFAYEELLNTSRTGDPQAEHDHTGNQFKAEKIPLRGGQKFAWLLNGVGVGLVLSALGFWLLPTLPGEAGNTAQVAAVQAANKNAGQGLVENKKPVEPESYVKFDSLKMSDQLHKIPAH